MTNENWSSKANSQDLANNSGQGPSSPVLDIVAKKFNWGAFLLSWIWGLGNKTFITLIVFVISFIAMIPFLGWIALLGVQIWFGIKGNEWAWQNKRWDSIEEFHSVQKKWAIAGVILNILFYVIVILMLIATSLPIFMNDLPKQQNETTLKKSIITIIQAAEINKVLEETCEPTSEGLASCFAKQASVAESHDNVVKTFDDVTWTFTGNGLCENTGECYVTISNSKKLNEVIPLTVENGYMTVHAEGMID